MGSALELLTSKTTHKVEQAKIDGKRMMQKGQNELAAATTSLANFQQSLGNKKKMDAAGKSFNAQQQNLQSMLDQAATGTFQQRMQTAAEAGSAMVAASAAGVGGSSVELYRRTLALNSAINEQASTAAVDKGVIYAKDEMSSTIADTLTSLNNETFNTSLDYSTVIDHVEQKNVVGSFIAAGVATYFGGPQAGQAVLDVSAAGGRLANGDRAGGAALLSSAASKAYGAFKAYGSDSGPATDTRTPTQVAKAQAAQKSQASSMKGFWQDGRSSGLTYSIK